MTLQGLIYHSASEDSSSGGSSQKPRLEILNQLLLPHRTVYVSIRNSRAAFAAIKQMLIRGAPAIALAAVLALSVEDPWNPDTDANDPETSRTTKSGEDIKFARDLEESAPAPPSGHLSKDASPQNAADWYAARLDYLVKSRPTAVNLADAARKLKAWVRERAASADKAEQVTREYRRAAEQLLEDDVRDNENIGEYGRSWIEENTGISKDRKGAVLTHCNTGSLATAGYGTALGIVRSLHHAQVLHQAFYTETRPYNQGSRLTGYELLHDRIPATLITDSMAGSLFRLKAHEDNIVAVIVGADRVAANGDTANKIGTYGLACLARQHGLRFVVAAPRTTIDLDTASGAEIEIEERPQQEVLGVKGPVVTAFEDGKQKVNSDEAHTVSTAALGTRAWNPSFDVTPADLIDAIVTEVGVAKKVDGRFALKELFHEAR